MRIPAAKRGELKPQVRFVTVRGPRELPCVWGTQRDAILNADPDEYVVRVKIEPWTKRKAKP